MSSQKHQYKDIGGQAVMEGVMMQSPSDESIAIAVRRPNGKIMVTCKHNEPLSKKHKWMGLPFIPRQEHPDARRHGRRTQQV